MSGPSRPAVTLKIATSLDGRIATASGESQWITCEESRRAVQTLRAAHDAILVGVETAIKDNPLLTVRTDPPPGRQPLRIVADSRLRTPLNSRLIGSVAEAPVALATGVDIDERRADPYLDRGVDVWELPIAPFGGVSVTGLLARCAEEGVKALLLEGGGRLAASFLKAGCVDRIEWFRAPIIIGGDGLPAVAALGRDALSDSPRFRREALQPSGADVWETYIAVIDSQD